MKLLFSLVAMVGVLGCSSSQKEPEPTVLPAPKSTNQFERTLTLKVEGYSKGSVEKKTFVFFKEEGEAQSLKFIPQYEMISRALGQDGYTQVEKASQAEFVIEAAFDMEKPFTGSSIFGNLTPYIHKMTLKAKREKTPFWEITIKGPSEYDDRIVVLPAMLAAGVGLYGKSTATAKEIKIKNSDALVKTIRGE
jgi:hypothetical protein